MDESSREVPNLRNLRLPMRLKVGDYVKLHNGYERPKEQLFKDLMLY